MQNEGYPLIDISGARSNAFTHTQFHQIPTLLQEEDRALVDIHPDDARILDIEVGDLVEISSPRGQTTLESELVGTSNPAP